MGVFSQNQPPKKSHPRITPTEKPDRVRSLISESHVYRFEALCLGSVNFPAELDDKDGVPSGKPSHPLHHGILHCRRSL